MLTITHREKSKQYTRWFLINVFEFLCLCFFSLSARKGGFSLCLGFDQRIIVDVAEVGFNFITRGFHSLSRD